MKKLFVVLIALLVLPSITLAAKGGNKPPPNEDLQNQVNENTQDIQTNTDAITAEEATRQVEDADLQAQIDNIQPVAAGGVKVYAKDGIEIGLLIAVTDEIYKSIYAPVILSDTDYMFQLTKSDGNTYGDRFYFEEPNCEGQVYSYTGYCCNASAFLSNQGGVFTDRNSSDSIRYYYSPKGNVPLTGELVTQSYSRGSQPECINRTDTFILEGNTLFAVYPNDPNITGVNPPYEMPYTFGR
ncbi:hypothetical protein ACFLZQ_04090 [Thermodesulfobacteriota bacterium]